MNSLKSLDELMHIDKQHLFLEKIGGKKVELTTHHGKIASIELYQGLHQTIRDQFNIARNIALHSYFFIP